MSIVGIEVAAPETARFGSLDPEVARDLSLLREFTANRQRHFNRLFGRRLRHSPLRDELIRLLVLSFAASRHQRMAVYVRACAAFGTEPSVRAEIDNLVAAGLVVLTRDQSHARAILLQPTVKLITFYNEQMPRLRTEVLSLLASVEAKADD